MNDEIVKDGNDFEVKREIRDINKKYLNLSEDVKLGDKRFSNMWLRLIENEKNIERCAKSIDNIVKLLKLNIENKEQKWVMNYIR